MKKKLYFGSNFKMYKNMAETETYLNEFAAATKQIPDDKVQFFFIPSYTAIGTANRNVHRDRFLLGAQNMCWEEEGQFTGEISPRMLKELNVDLIMVGHSERRHTFLEDDYMENRKCKKALEQGFRLLLAIGETAEEKEYGISAEALRRQLKIGLHEVSPTYLEKIWIAYEPVWSIGVNGTPAPASYAEEMHEIIRQTLAELFGPDGKTIPLLYGGSVNPENAASLIAQPDIDGLFTTRTAFQVDRFAKIISDSLNALP